MGIKGEFVNFTQDFHNLKVKPTVINDRRIVTSDQRSEMTELLRVTQDTRALSNIPECRCRATKYGANLGKICPKCGEEVVFPYAADLTPIAWIRAPKGIYKRKLIHPNWLLMLRNVFTLKSYKFDFIEWFINPSYRYTVAPAELMLFEGWMRSHRPKQIPRGWNSFVENFEELFNYLSQLKCFASKQANILGLQLIMQTYPDCLFPEYVPLLNRSLVTVDNNEMGSYSDDTSVEMQNAASFMVGIDVSLFPKPQHLIEAATAKAMLALSRFATLVYGGIVTLKSGLYRRQLFGTRSHWASRAVIVSITDPHDYTELHVPWRCGVGMYQLHLANYMLRPMRNGKPGFTPNQVWNKLNRAGMEYDTDIDEMLNELIGDKTSNRLPCTFQRNPSLLPVAAQTLRITKFKTDVTDPTFGFSILDVKGPNADFDGDNMNCALWLDRVTGTAALALAPHRSAISVVEHRTLNPYAAMPKPVVFMMTNYFNHPFDKLPIPKGPNPLDEMQEIFEP